MKNYINYSMACSALLLMGISSAQADTCLSPCEVSNLNPNENPILVLDDSNINSKDWHLTNRYLLGGSNVNGGAFTIAPGDATTTLPSFIIHPNAADFGFTIGEAGVGINITQPMATLHVSNGPFGDPDAPTQILVNQDQSAMVEARTLFKLENPGNTKFGIENTATGEEWALAVPGPSLRISKQGSGVVEAELDSGGNLFLAGTLIEGSSRSIKHGIEDVDTQEVLDKVLSMPIVHWSYNRDSDDVRHMGPLAEDFYTAFGLGKTNKGIASLDSSGVAFASIQALQEQMNKRMQAKNQQIESLTMELNNQHKELSDLKKMVQALVAKDQVAALRVSQ